MSKLAGIGIGAGVTILGVLWYWGIIIHWLWNGLTHAGTAGWIVGYFALFIVFVLLSIPVTVGLILGYIMAAAVGGG